VMVFLQAESPGSIGPNMARNRECKYVCAYLLVALPLLKKSAVTQTWGLHPDDLSNLKYLP
jgi:hypothetical protein